MFSRNWGILTDWIVSMPTIRWNGPPNQFDLHQLIDPCAKHHKYIRTDSVDFASVVIVKSNYEGGIEGLKGLKYCHPGFYYGRTERWSERFLKHFERSILEKELDAQCNSPLGDTGSPAEIEIAAIGNYFGPSCRAGSWSNNEQEDKRLSSSHSNFYFVYFFVCFVSFNAILFSNI